jgi:hypothetical protein
MKIFLSHASEDKEAAESVAYSLRNRGHLVFLDRDDLPVGRSYDQRIELAIKDSDLFIFLISPPSVAQGRYTLTELAFARRKWPNPTKHILPVMAVKTPFKEIPGYLKAVTVLEPLGNITAETAAAVDDLASADRGADDKHVAFFKLLAVIGIVGAVITSILSQVPAATEFGQVLESLTPEAGLSPFTMPIFLGMAFWGILETFAPKAGAQEKGQVDWPNIWTVTGTVGVVLTSILSHVPAATEFGQVLERLTPEAGLSPFTMPIFLAIAAWGVVGKLRGGSSVRPNS